MCRHERTCALLGGVLGGIATATLAIRAGRSRALEDRARQLLIVRAAADKARAQLPQKEATP